MKDYSGFFVCCKPHRANDHHSRHEVSKETNKFKSRNPTPFLTTDDYNFIDGMFTMGEDEVPNDENNDLSTNYDYQEADWIDNPDSCYEQEETFGLA